MIVEKIDLILGELKDGTGAAMAATVNRAGVRAGLKVWFDDLDERHGPVAEIRPFGLKGHRIEIYFGNFSGEVIAQIKNATSEDRNLAKSLVSSIDGGVELDFHGQTINNWEILNGSFRITATVRNLENSQDDASITATCRDVIVPMMAAFAELIGYDEIIEEPENETPLYEGGILQTTIKRRERNPRNRLLCIRIHGEHCKVCGVSPHEKYGAAGSIIEVHHLEPLSLLQSPQIYNPETDLIPLCPSCHRAIHTQKPVPLAPEDLKKMMERHNAP